MTDTAPLAASDSVIPFMFESLPVRGALVQLQRPWLKMLAVHDYAPVIRDIFGQAAAATTLIAQSLKFDGSVTLQVKGDGPLSMLVMQCTDELEIRGIASTTGDVGEATFAELVNRAHCSVIVDSGNMEQPYQGVVEMHPDSLAASLEGYFKRSVQVGSRLVLYADGELCGGLLLQQMPDRGTPLEDDWRRLGFLAETLTGDDLRGGVGLELLHKLFNEDDVRVFAARDVRFQCRCSRSRAEQVLKMLGADETRAACQELGRVDVSCEYCGRSESFDAVDISRLFAEGGVSGPGTLQ